MTTSSLFIIYNNARELLKCRGASNIEEPRFDSEASLVEYMQKNNNYSNNSYIIVNSDDMQVIIFAADSEATKSGGLEKIFKNHVKKYTIFVLPTVKEFASLTTYLSKISKSPYSKPSQLLEPGIACAYKLEITIHSTMLLKTSSHISSARYELVSPEEVATWSQTVQRSLSYLPKIPFTDPNLFWYGGFKEGDIVNEFTKSPTACESCEMKLVSNLHNFKISKTSKQNTK